MFISLSQLRFVHSRGQLETRVLFEVLSGKLGQGNVWRQVGQSQCQKQFIEVNSTFALPWSELKPSFISLASLIAPVLFKGLSEKNVVQL